MRLDMFNAGILSAVAVAIWIGTLVVQVLFAIAVYNDALKRKQKGQGFLFVSAELWICAALLVGPVLAVLYWIVHNSKIAPEEDV